MVNPTEHHAKSQFMSMSGVFAMLASSLRATGIGAPSSRRTRLALAPLLAALLALAFSASTALAAEVHVFSSSFGSAGQGAGQLELAANSGVSVNDSSGDVYVADSHNHRVDEFDPSKPAGEEFIRAWGWGVADGSSELQTCTTSCQVGIAGSEPGQFGSPTFIAVDNSGGASHGDVYVADTADSVITKFEADGTLVASWGVGGQLDGSAATSPPEPFAGPFAAIVGIAVDASGNLDVLENSAHALFRFGEDATFLIDFETPRGSAAAGLAVDPGGNFFKVNGFPNVEKFDAAGSELGPGLGQVTLPAEPGPTEAATGLAVDPASGTLYVDHGGTSLDAYAFAASGEVIGSGCIPAPFAGCTPTGSFGTGDLTSGAGLAVDGSSHVLYAADAGAGQIAVFIPAVLPDASTEPATVVKGGVTLHGVVNAAGGPPATCVFQYVEVTAKGFEGATSVPCSPAGPFTGSTGVPVSAEINGLPEAYYRFRLLATNINGDSEGATLLFATSNTFGLPDGRAYEMISPPQKSGEVIPPEQTRQLDGSCGDCLPGQATPAQPMQSAPDGDSVLYLGEPFSSGLAAGPNDYLAARAPVGWATQSLSSPVTTGLYQAFSPDLSRAVLHQGEPALSPAAPTRGGKAFANLYLVQGGALQPLVTREPPNRAPTGSPGEFVIRFAGANAGTASEAPFEHVIFAADDALTEVDPGIAPKAPEVEAMTSCTAVFAAGCDLYDWAGGRLRLVNVLPGNASAAPHAVIGSGQLLGAEQTPNVDHAISADGRRVFWSEEESGQVYVRIDEARTLEVPGPGTCKQSVSEGERVCFLTASTDGSQVLLSNGEVFALNEAQTAYGPALDLTNGSGGFQGILGASEDLSRVYFTDTAVLTGEAQNANGEHAEEGRFNLYISSKGAVTFIGILAPEDNQINNQEYGAWRASRPYRTAQVTPDGGHLAFMSQVPLTGYDNTHDGSSGSSCNSEEEPHPGVPCREVFEYDAEAKKLSCASCNPSGARPIGPSNLSLIAPREALPPFRQPGNLSSDGGGRLFLESQDVLSPRDTNGHIQDIYEWEPAGVGSCKRAAGCVYLISSGHGPNDSMFLDSTPSGNDVFFITRDQLLPQDKDQQLDLYDARVGGSIESSETPPCGGEACRGPLSGPPAPPAPASSTFSGPGNLVSSLTPPPAAKPKPLTRAQKLARALKACAKKPKRKRRACRAQARKRYGPAAARTKHKSKNGGR